MTNFVTAALSLLALPALACPDYTGSFTSATEGSITFKQTGCETIQVTYSSQPGIYTFPIGKLSENPAGTLVGYVWRAGKLTYVDYSGDSSSEETFILTPQKDLEADTVTQTATQTMTKSILYKRNSQTTL